MILCANPLAQNDSYKDEIQKAISSVLVSNRYILGPEVETLEEEFASFIGVKHSIGVANGTDAIEIALRSLGIGPGDEVVTVSHTAVATVAAIEAAGATPVLVDVDPNFFTLDPSQLDEVFTVHTKAVIAVHLYGQSADLDRIQTFCQEKGIYLIEDVSQAHGSTWKGKKLGSIGHVGCFSCYPTKNLGAVGDAGLITTNDSHLASKMRMLREYGWKDRYISEFAGRNSRLDELQAAILRVKLRNLDSDNGKRRTIAAKYDQGLQAKAFKIPAKNPNSEHVYHLYVIQIDKREELILRLKSEKIFPGVHYPIPIHLQPAYLGKIKTASSMKVTEDLSRTVLSLPMYPELPSDDVQKVISSVSLK
ncbi:MULTISPECIES: DegT/DnrJ/EryC1/StrS family aminotransferase [Leptospira]|uniref:Pleiotropic regulatory protein DegT n=1 Tax=Leptospira borgpetersenii serovar Javanica str. UI 09931 TaxID=1049767 RepID=A0AAV3J9N8_LEPBO|nr:MULTISPECIES: DegT/DnrJ/EryC1/StrS family aminotransferase [Leptospira]EMO08128.1 putative pleiotropic regulatory protein DegT [Leptospira borgpetersenii str. Noumea 25]AXX16258.1 DegT/DnrJ/EryC1/StrS family aminotransferase [Leptospira borgpetersenii serovar Ceylonica]EKQ99270.1 putative pleiotropic regulatory protein DegT [Leptospira borgpetersenii serovar Castellonis str. 200801910]EMK08769.1 putative pleiotropic regulatory protein DegT [Leptospira sp. serovar Kenya str. Sh9]EMN58585.1 p